MEGMYTELIIKLIRFCVVGFSGMIVDFGTTWALKEKVKVNKYLANTTGFILAATSNYILNRIWTFQSHNKEVATEYASFIAISLIGLGINNLILFLLTDKLRWNFYLSKLCAIAVVTVWNFGMNYVFTFGAFLPK
jgi:putative flippase GtrA